MWQQVQSFVGLSSIQLLNITMLHTLSSCGEDMKYRFPSRNSISTEVESPCRQPFTLVNMFIVAQYAYTIIHDKCVFRKGILYRGNGLGEISSNPLCLMGKTHRKIKPWKNVGIPGIPMKKKVGTQNGRPMIKHFFHGKLWKTMETHRTHEKKHWKAMENYGKP